MLLSAIETIARVHLVEPTASFWTSAELISLMNLGIHDLWRSVHLIDKDHFHTVDTTNVTLAASTATLSGVPAGVARVLGIEIRDMATYPNMTFEPRPFMHPDMVRARQSSAIAFAVTTPFYYSIVGTGAPIAAPTIYMAPLVSAGTGVPMLLRLIYVPVLADLTSSGTNPIPGESDQALVAWTVAYARAKEREDRQPDPNWLAVYQTEKLAVLDAIFERQTQFGHKLLKPVVNPGGYDEGKAS